MNTWPLAFGPPMSASHAMVRSRLIVVGLFVTVARCSGAPLANATDMAGAVAKPQLANASATVSKGTKHTKETPHKEQGSKEATTTTAAAPRTRAEGLTTLCAKGNSLACKVSSSSHGRVNLTSAVRHTGGNATHSKSAPKRPPRTPVFLMIALSLALCLPVGTSLFMVWRSRRNEQRGEPVSTVDD